MNVKKESITILVPAYNEEKGLNGAVTSTDRIARSMFRDYEIIIFDDCSHDRTGEIADKLAKKFPKARVVHNRKNMGLGYNYRKAVELATKKYFTMVTGENEILPDSLKKILASTGEADIIIPYNINTEIRPFYRRAISSSFTALMNILFGMRLNYYLGPVVHKTELLKKARITTNSFAYQAEILVHLIKKGKCSYKEVGVYNRKPEKTSMFKIKNLMGVGKTVITLFFDIYFKKSRL
ncbi:glycosyltransferase family 2 protein [Candidatus Woesearchaeota archaeon]|nr:glycosyltransferase family 2 protein [Candidatus Woesearchaeota archaeon]